MPSKIPVPQATLYRIRSVVNAIVGGAATGEQIAAAISCSPRHASYGIAAARSLELVAGSKRALELSPLGQQLASTVRDSAEESAAFRRAVADSPVIAILAPGLLSPTPPSKDEIAAHIEQAAGLSASTAAHRAAMLLQWQQQLLAAGALRPTRKIVGRRWRRLSLSNYRCFANASAVLAPLTVIVGGNGTGKSTVADALAFVRDVAQDATAAVGSRGGIIRLANRWAARPTDVAVELRAAATEAGLDTDYVRHRIELQPQPSGGWGFGEELLEVVTKQRPTAHVRRLGPTVESIGPDAELDPMVSVASLVAKQRGYRRQRALRSARRLGLVPKLMRQPRPDTSATRLRALGGNVAVAVRSLQQTGSFDPVLHALGPLIPGLRSIEIDALDGSSTLRVRAARPSSGEVADFHAAELSDGALRALGIGVAAAQLGRDQLLIIEQPEVAIAPAAVAGLFELLVDASQRGSVLLVTHSPDWLAAAAAGGERILVCKTREGAACIGPLAAEQQEQLRQGSACAAALLAGSELRMAASDDEAGTEVAASDGEAGTEVGASAGQAGTEAGASDGEAGTEVAASAGEAGTEAGASDGEAETVAGVGTEVAASDGEAETD